MKTEHEVVIAGGGPTGKMLAAELALGGADVVIVERRATDDLVGVRAGGLHAHALELLDQRGVAERFLARGRSMQVAGFALIPLDIGDLPIRRNHGLALSQNHIEHLLADWIDELRVPVLRGRDVTSIAPDADGVDVALSDGSCVRGRYLVGCDGGRSVVRKQAGIGFPGWDPSISYLLAECEMTDPAWGARRDDHGVNAIAKMEDGRARVVLNEKRVVEGEPTVDDLRAALVALYGTDFAVHGVTWLSRFTDMARQADAYRSGRVLVAGDAAHVHSPAGGQGLNLGLYDAVNLGWKLALVARGACPDALLDTYHAEQHPLGARVLQLTLAMTALGRGDDRSSALHACMTDLLKMEAPRRRYAAMLSGLDIRYDLGDEHPLVGRHMPDWLVTIDGVSRRISSLLHAARPVLIRFATGRSSAEESVASTEDEARGEDVRPDIDSVDAHYEGPWELPLVGAIDPPRAVLLRPDGFVAWVGNATDTCPREILTRWFGPPESAVRQSPTSRSRA